MKQQKKKVDFRDSKFLKIAFISGVLIAVLSYLSGLFSSLMSNSVFSFLYSLICLILSILFTYGFYILGKRYDNQLLKIMAILIIISLIIMQVVSLLILNPIIMNISTSSLEVAKNLGINESAIAQGLSTTQAQELMQNLFANPEFKGGVITLLVLFGFYLISAIVIAILFGVSLLRLKNKVKYSKVAGILEIVGGATLILFGLGLVLMLIAYVYELIIFYQESKK
jgi:hypothetical protein